MKLFQKVLIGFVLGAILGAIWGPGIVWIKPIGTIFISLLKMLIIPLIFATLVVGVASIAEPKKLGRVAGKTIAYYLVTTAFAIIIGGPAKEAAGAPSLVDTIVNLIPKNPIGAMAEGKVLQVIVFALFFGYAMTKAGEKGKAVLKFFEGFAETMYKLTGTVMGFAPYGVFALIATTVGTHGSWSFCFGTFCQIDFCGVSGDNNSCSNSIFRDDFYYCQDEPGKIFQRV
jgi:Na+/H+-dicarboxylate symporter